MKKAVIYCRVSTPRQAAEGDSLESQESVCRDYCRFRGWEVLEPIFADEGKSAWKDTGRPGLQAAINAAGRPDHVLVAYDLSRIGRSARITLTVCDLLEDAGATIVTVRDNIDPTSASGKCFRTILAAICEMQSDQHSERVKLANETTVSRLGYRTQGPCPFGYKFDHNTRERTEDAAEQKIIRKVLAVRAKYDSNAKAAKRLNRLGVHTPAKIRHGVDSKWSPEIVRRIVMRQEEALKPAESGN